MSILNLFRKDKKFTLYRKITNGREVIEDTWQNDSRDSSLLQSDVVQKLIELGQDMGQATEEASLNPGFGLLYYQLTRLAKPDTALVIGSYRGFVPVCISLGLADNRKGICIFIDPGFEDAFWHNEDTVVRLNEKFNLDGRLKHVPMTTNDAYNRDTIPKSIDLLHIDGDHSYKEVKQDFDLCYPRVIKGGYVFLHDAVATGKGLTSMEVREFLTQEVQNRSDLEKITFPFDQGLAVLRKLS